MFLLTFIKVKGAWQILEMLSGSSPIFALSNHTTFAKLKLAQQSQ
jgi:hypothetical protein